MVPAWFAAELFSFSVREKSNLRPFVRTDLIKSGESKEVRPDKRVREKERERERYCVVG